MFRLLHPKRCPGALRPFGHQPSVRCYGGLILPTGSGSRSTSSVAYSSASAGTVTGTGTGGFGGEACWESNHRKSSLSASSSSSSLTGSALYTSNPPILRNQTRFLSTTSVEPQFEGVSEQVSKLIYRHAHQAQTSVSLQALMQTGRGEFLHKTFDHVDQNSDVHSATELVLIQVRSKGQSKLSEKYR
jgi:hypothetical protein